MIKHIQKTYNRKETELSRNRLIRPKSFLLLGATIE